MPESIYISEILPHPSGKYLIATGQTAAFAPYLVKVFDARPAEALNVTDEGCVRTGFLS